MKKLILLAALLLASCTTQGGSPSNELNKYLNSLDIEYVLHSEKCSSGFGGEYISGIRFDETKIVFTCLMFYQVIPIEKGWDNTKETRFYLVLIPETQNYYFLNTQSVINDKGELVEVKEYFRGKQ